MADRGIFKRQSFDFLAEGDGVTSHKLLDLVKTGTRVCFEGWQFQHWGGFVEGGMMAANEIQGSEDKSAYVEWGRSGHNFHDTCGKSKVACCLHEGDGIPSCCICPGPDSLQLWLGKQDP